VFVDYLNLIQMTMIFYFMKR